MLVALVYTWTTGCESKWNVLHVLVTSQKRLWPTSMRLYAG